MKAKFWITAAVGFVVSLTSAQEAVAFGSAKSDLWCRHTILVFAYPSTAKTAGLTVEDLQWLVAYRRLDGKPLDSFFDGFLVTGFGCKEGRHLLGGVARPALKSDWDDAITGYLDTAVKLSEAFAQVGRALKSPGRRAKVIVAIPYPDPRNTSFGPINGKSLDLSKQECRLETVNWYVDEVLKRWSDLAAQGRLGAARLAGFYWGQEGLLSVRTRDGVLKDADLVKGVAAHVHDKGLLLHWIPGFRGGRVFEKTPWKEIGFDCVTQQINYQNPEKPGRPLSIFDEMSEDVKRFDLHGVELTPNVRETSLNPRVWSRPQVHLANLEAALRLDWKRHAASTYFDGNSFIPIASEPKARIFYDKLYKWVKGNLTSQDVDELCDAVVADLKSRGVLSESTLKQIAEADTVLKKLRLMERPDDLRGAAHLLDQVWRCIVRL